VALAVGQWTLLGLKHFGVTCGAWSCGFRPFRLTNRWLFHLWQKMVLYSADKAVIVYILHSELYRIIIFPNNYNYLFIDITASAPTILTTSPHQPLTSTPSSKINNDLCYIWAWVSSVKLKVRDLTYRLDILDGSHSLASSSRLIIVTFKLRFDILELFACRMADPLTGIPGE
jgi:hypothetical protein